MMHQRGPPAAPPAGAERDAVGRHAAAVETEARVVVGLLHATVLALAWTAKWVPALLAALLPFATVRGVLGGSHNAIACPTLAMLVGVALLLCSRLGLLSTLYALAALAAFGLPICACGREAVLALMIAVAVGARTAEDRLGIPHDASMVIAATAALAALPLPFAAVVQVMATGAVVLRRCFLRDAADRNTFATVAGIAAGLVCAGIVSRM
jgi:hypothetical protein